MYNKKPHAWTLFLDIIYQNNDAHIARLTRKQRVIAYQGLVGVSHSPYSGLLWITRKATPVPSQNFADTCSQGIEEQITPV